MSDNCPVCKTVLNERTRTHKLAFSTYSYDCPRCGKFVFAFRETELVMLFNDSHDSDKRFVLSHNIRKMQGDDSEVVVDGNSVEKIVKGALPTPAEQKDIFIRWVGDHINAGGDYVKVNSFSIVGIIGGRTLKEFYFILDHLKKEGLIDSKTVVGGGEIEIVQVTLSFRGWGYYEELKRDDADSQENNGDSRTATENEQKSGPKAKGGSAETMPMVFLSHSSDDRAFVESVLVPLLHGEGIGTWCAPDDIHTADEWERRIVQGLQLCDWFLIVMSPNAIASEWVKAEVHWAMENRRQRIVPVMFAQCNPLDLHLKLPRIHYVDFQGNCDDAGEKLLATWNRRTLSGPQ